jgi:Ca-activated chloride channel family protein
MRRAPALLLLLLVATGAVYEWGGPARRGVRALKGGRFEEALGALEAGRADFPASAVLPYDEGLAHMGKGEPDSAAVRFREAMGQRGDPAREAAAYNLGNQSMRSKDYRNAARYYKEALRIRPGDLDAKRNLEEALRRLRQSSPVQRGQPPPSGGGGPNSRNGEKNPSPRPTSGGQTPPAPAPRGGGQFTREEAERLLQALESERRGQRQEGKGRPEQETGNRDW